MKENKISIEITADGWKTDVTINGKTYSERHIGHYMAARSASRGTLKKMMKSPNQSTMRSTTFSASAANRHWRSLKLKRESRRNSHGDQTKISVRRG